MSKQSGLGDHLAISGYDVSNDIGSLDTIHGGPAALPMTGIDKQAFERVGGLRDGGITFMAYHNDNPTIPVGAHIRLSGLSVADQIVTYFHGSALGGASASMVAKQVDYAGNRGTDGMLTYSVPEVSNGFGLEWGVQATPFKRTDATATNGSPVDLATASPGAFGGSAYLHVYAFTGTSATIKLQSATTSGGAYTDITGGAFSSVTAIGAERIVTAAEAVSQFVRVATSGTFSNLVFTVQFERFPVLTAF